MSGADPRRRPARDYSAWPQTLVAFHAHPDDESIATGGVLAQAADAGHRVVLVVATRGELGTAGPGELPAGPELGVRRTQETERAAQILGVSHVEFLGYHDSGMAGTPTNDAPGSFWTADVDEAAKRLAAILDEEHADVLTVYDERGIYDHPDHIQVHRVGIRAAELAGTPRVYESTIDSSYLRDLMEHVSELIPEGLPAGTYYLIAAVSAGTGTKATEVIASTLIQSDTRAGRLAVRRSGQSTQREARATSVQ